MKKKKIVKKLKLKESVKNALVIITCIIILIAVLFGISNRIEQIENNPNAYDNRSTPVNVHPNR